MREAAASAGARGEAQVMGPSVRARRRLVWLGAKRGGGQGGRRTCSQRAVALADGVARFVETPVTTLQNQVLFIQPMG
jgi:hypothetical protein